VKRILLGFLVSILSFLLVTDLIFIVWGTDIKLTALSPAWVEGQLDNLQVYQVVRNQLKDELVKQPHLASHGAEITNILNQTLNDTWMHQQAHTALNAFYPYLKGDAGDFNFTVSLVDLKTSLKSAFPNPDAKAEIDKALPDEFTGNKTELEQSAQGRDAVRILENARTGIHYFSIAYYVGIAVAVGLAALIWVVYRRLKPISRTLGICALVVGAATLIAIYVPLAFAPRLLEPVELPSPMTHDMVLGVLRALVSPARIFAIVLAAVGVGLIILSVVWKEHKAEK
jgi:hypothetical protein